MKKRVVGRKFSFVEFRDRSQEFVGKIRLMQFYHDLINLSYENPGATKLLISRNLNSPLLMHMYWLHFLTTKFSCRPPSLNIPRIGVWLSLNRTLNYCSRELGFRSCKSLGCFKFVIYDLTRAYWWRVSRHCRFRLRFPLIILVI